MRSGRASYLDWAFDRFSGYITAAELYDGPSASFRSSITGHSIASPIKSSTGNQQAVAGSVGEGVDTHEARDRRVGERAIGVQRQRPMGRWAFQDGSQRAAVKVGIVAQDTCARTINATPAVAV